LTVTIYVQHVHQWYKHTQYRHGIDDIFKPLATQKNVKT